MHEAVGPRRSLPLVVRQLGAVSFFNDLASEMVYPLLPALVTVRLGGTALALGALDGVAEAVAAAVKAGAGRLADRPRWRRPLVVAGYAVAMLARPAIGIASAVWHVVTLRGVDRLGKGIRTPPRDAVIADATPLGLHGRAFGFHRAMDHAGAVVGPLIAWALLAATRSTVEEIILWSLIPGAFAVVVVIWAMRGAEGGPQGPSGEVPTGSGDQESGAYRESMRVRYTAGLIVAFAFVRFPETLLLLRAQNLGLSLAGVPALWAAMHVVRASASYPGGWLSDVLGPRRTMLLGWAVYAVVCFGLAAAGGAVPAVVLLLVFGLVAAGTESPERAFIAAASRTGRRGTGFGAYHAAVGFVALPGGLLLGGLYEWLGASLALQVSGGATLLLIPLGFAAARVR